MRSIIYYYYYYTGFLKIFLKKKKERKEKRIYSFDWVINYCLYYIALLGNVDSRNNEYQSCPLESERGVFSEGNFWMYGCDFRVKIMGFWSIRYPPKSVL